MRPAGGLASNRNAEPLSCPRSARYARQHQTLRDGASFDRLVSGWRRRGRRWPTRRVTDGRAVILWRSVDHRGDLHDNHRAQARSRLHLHCQSHQCRRHRASLRTLGAGDTIGRSQTNRTTGALRLSRERQPSAGRRSHNNPDAGPCPARSGLTLHEGHVRRSVGRARRCRCTPRAGLDGSPGVRASKQAERAPRNLDGPEERSQPKLAVPRPYSARWTRSDQRCARAAEPERMVRAPKYRATLVDPYRDHLRERRAEDPAVPIAQLLREIRKLGYRAARTCSSATSPRAASNLTGRTCHPSPSPGSCSPGRTPSTTARGRYLASSPPPAPR